MKYIMLEAKLDGGIKQKFPIIFPSILIHRHVANSMTMLLDRVHGIEAKAVSAGEINSELACSGGSETLNLVHDPSDTVIIRTYDLFHGLV